MISLFSALLPALLLGLASTGHCSLMCGGITTAHAMQGNHRAYLIVQLGRFTSYMLIGILFFLVGQVTELNQLGHGVVSTVNAIILFAIGIALLPIKQRIALPFARATSRLWQWCKSKSNNSFLNQRVYLRSFISGCLWGLLPCSMVYTAAMLSIVQTNWAIGALTMIAFGIGTLPGIVGSYTMMAQFRTLISHRYFKMACGGIFIFWGMLLLLLNWLPVDVAHHH